MITGNLVLPTSSSTIARDNRPISKGLAALVAKLNAAAADVNKWSSREDELNIQFRQSAGPAPKVKGGVTGASKLIREGYPDMDLPVSDWFYRSREDIKKGEEQAVLDVTSEQQLAEVEARFADLLADWDVQEAAYNSAAPRGLAHAKRMLNKAHRAWSAAEDEIVNYRPRTLEEVIELMAYAGRDEMRGVFFTPDEGHLKFMMRNVSEVLATLNAREMQAFGSSRMSQKLKRADRCAR